MDSEKLLEYVRTGVEGTYLERKSARISPKDIVRHVIAFANANGGILAIGIEDDGELSGFGISHAHRPDEYKEMILQNCYPLPSYHFQTILYGKADTDFVLVIEIDISARQVITKMPERAVYLRISDKSVLLAHDQITRLEYDKGQRFFEEQEIGDATIEEDIDLDIIREYCEKMDVDREAAPRNLLASRGFIRNGHLTNAAILLFGNNPTKFLPQARVRFLRYDGVRRQTGERINIVKEKTFDAAIPVALQEILAFMRPQMREFQTLGKDGRFRIVPEYPEFAWTEGIVNAVTHRDYSISGDHIRISMYDDRLEIFSPGNLPNIVTLENMKYTRFSRNPKIARILTELGWVKELNEGVNRIYEEMDSFYLQNPMYLEPNHQAVQLVLENNMKSRKISESGELAEWFAKEWTDLSSEERLVMKYMSNNEKTKVKDVALILDKGVISARKIMKRLLDKGIVEWNGTSVNDPRQYYVLRKKK